MSLNFKLRVAGSSAPHSLQVPSDVTCGDFLEQCTTTCGSIEGILFGFPPRSLELGAHPDAALLSTGVRNGETLIIKTVVATPSPLPSATSSRERLGRASKDVAGSKIQDQIKRDAELSASASHATPKRATKAASAASSASATKQPSGESSAKKRGSAWKAAGPGHLCSDALTPLSSSTAADDDGDASAAAAVPAEGRQKRRRVNLAASSRGVTLEERLVSSGRGGAALREPGDATIDFLREASKAALASQYEMTRANARLAAALSGRYEIKPDLAVRSLGSGIPVTLLVRYDPSASTGTSAAAGFANESHWVEERVDNLPAGAVIAVLHTITGSASGTAAVGADIAAGASAAAAPAAALDEGEREAAEAQRELVKPHMMSQVSDRGAVS